MQQTNWYTLVFAFGMAAFVALSLTSMREAWKDKQKANELLFNKTQILNSVMTVDQDTDVENIFGEKVKGLLIDSKGEVVEENTTLALEVDIKKEQRKPLGDQKLPLFTFESEEGTKYIIPTLGSGLWGWISAYLALEEDKNQVAGITFDHEAETPGLGAKIKDDPGFFTDFVGEKVFDDNGELVGVLVRKGNNDPQNNDKSDHTIDAISGATITGDGVEIMIQDDLEFYIPFLTKDKEVALWQK